jgi:hypothetical protein
MGESRDSIWPSALCCAPSTESAGARPTEPEMPRKSSNNPFELANAGPTCDSP